jgi:hypothetical protein
MRHGTIPLLDAKAPASSASSVLSLKIDCQSHFFDDLHSEFRAMDTEQPSIRMKQRE